MEKNECTFHWTWRSKSKTWLLLMKSWMSKAKTWMLHKSKLNVECKKVESRVQTQMTNTKCRIDCAKYKVKWNIEFWRKWNAILKLLMTVMLMVFTYWSWIKISVAKKCRLLWTCTGFVFNRVETKGGNVLYFSQISISLLIFKRIKGGRDENVSTLQCHEL